MPMICPPRCGGSLHLPASMCRPDRPSGARLPGPRAGYLSYCPGGGDLTRRAPFFFSPDGGCRYNGGRGGPAMRDEAALRTRASLLLRLRAGADDPGAWREFVQQYGPLLMG